VAVSGTNVLKEGVDYGVLRLHADTSRGSGCVQPSCVPERENGRELLRFGGVEKWSLDCQRPFAIELGSIVVLSAKSWSIERVGSKSFRPVLAEPPPVLL
jgi:hypothetical protein